MHEIITARRGLQEFMFSLGDIDTESYLAGPRDQIVALREQLEPISEAVESGGLNNLSLDALLTLELDIRTEIGNLETLATALRTRAGLRDEQLDELRSREANWDRLTSAASQRQAPAEVLEIADAATRLLAQTSVRLRADRDAVLTLLGSTLDLQLDAAAFSREVRGRRQSLESASQLASGLPLWNPQLAITRQQLDAARASLADYARSIRQYLSNNGLVALTWFLLSAALTFWLLRAGRSRVRKFLEKPNAGAPGFPVFEKAGAAALLVGLTCVLSFAPAAPVAFTDILIALLPWPAARLATAVFARPLRLSVVVLAAALSILALRPFYDLLPLAARSVNIVLTLAVASALYADLRRGNWERAFTGVRATYLRSGVLVLCIALLVALLADVVGFVGLANTFRTLTLGAMGYGLIFLVLTYVLNGLILALLQTPALKKLSTVKHEPWAIIGVTRKLIKWIAIFSWAALTLSMGGLSGRLETAFQQLLLAEVSIGAISIRAASLLVGLLVIWLTWLISRFIRFVMMNRALDYESAARGLTFAISKVFGYAIIVAGFLLALGAMGFDMTRVTVLAGALGVGIGLGLQNIANNFVSGIILLFERPVQVDDIAMVDNTLGTIKEIGIRSTVIQTYDGAEVIVPNADFMAKNVLNWTKSNRRRRAEIDLGVAYGTDTSTVLEILNEAARSHQDVLDDPEPLATFTGFGDSSLNFRLYIWLSDLANFLKAPSVIRQSILTRLNDAGIEIPFPQRDIRVTMSPSVDERGPPRSMADGPG